MYSIEEVYSQSLSDEFSIQVKKPLGFSVVNYGVKIQKFNSKIELLNCSKSGNYFQEFTEDEYNLFYQYGWKEGGVRLSLLNYKRKLDLVNDKIRIEINTRKNNKHISKLKSTRENLLVRYATRNKQLNKIKSNEKKHF
jgi:hypothetical protein